MTFGLRPEGAATLVTIAQARLVGAPTSADREKQPDCEANWSKVLEGQSKVLEDTRAA